MPPTWNEIEAKLDEAIQEWHRLDILLHDCHLNGKRRDVLNEQENATDSIISLHRIAIEQLENETGNLLTAELLFSQRYQSIASKYDNNGHIPQPSYACLNHWIDEVTGIVVERLHHDAEKAIKEQPADHKDTKTNKLMLRLTQSSDSLRRMARGFITDFLHQTEENITPCNIKHDRNPVAKEAWSKCTPQEFHTAAAPGLFHTAVSLNDLKHNYSDGIHGSTAYHALGRIIKTATIVFGEQYGKLGLSYEPKASVYNDEVALIRLASLLDKTPQHIQR